MSTASPPESRLRPLVRDETTEALYAAARETAERLAPVSLHRALRDTTGGCGSTPLWRGCVDLGWTAIPFSEAQGGLGLGMWELAAVQEALGRTLSATPLLSSIVLSGQAIARGGDTPLGDTWIPRLIAGDHRLAFAHDERPHRGRRGTRAVQTSHGWRLEGAKSAVVDGLGADAYLVSAATDAGVGLFLVAADTPGLHVEPLHRIDARNAASLRLDVVETTTVVAAPGSAVVGEVLDLARVAVAAELLGLATAAFEQTLAYVKTRQQFGVAIGSFQALQHRSARMFIALELARSAVLAAASAADDAPELLPRYATLAKARANDAAQRVTEEAIQMHGGIGMTDECDIGFYLKRARVAMETAGSSAWCRARWAALAGY